MNLGALFKRRPPAMVGLDISASGVKLVELNQDSQGGWILERCAVEPLEPGWVIDGAIAQFDEVSAAIKRLVKKSGTRAKHVAMALPHSAVITKRIIVSANLSEQELEVQVESEANQYIPFPLDEVSLDFCVMGPSVRSADEVDVLLAATRKEKVDERHDLAVLSGLKPLVMDVESYAARLAAGRWISSQSQLHAGSLVALMKIGARTSTLQVVRDDDILHDSEQSFGGSQLTQMIARHYGLGWEEAEQKKRAGDLPADYPEQVLQPFVAGIAYEVARALQFFFTSTPFNSVQQILLFGGSAGVEGLAQAVQQHTGVATQVLNPFEGMRVAGAVAPSKLHTEAPAYLTACGLAMRRFLS